VPDNASSPFEIDIESLIQAGLGRQMLKFEARGLNWSGKAWDFIENRDLYHA
jgi:hypothetical protein